MAITFLKNVHETTKKRVIDFLHENMRATEKGRPLTKIHASSLTSVQSEYCPREVRIMMEQGLPPNKQHIPAALRYTFDEGKDKQKRFNDDWMVGRMIGFWRCQSCRKLSDFGRRPKVSCECGFKMYEYTEARFQHPVSKAIGSVDAIMDLDEAQFKVGELKIIKSEDFKKLKAPLAEHRIRTQLYLRLIAESDIDPDIKSQINTDEAHIVYMMRAHGMKNDEGIISPFKEFMVKRDDAAVEPYFAKAHAVTFSKEGEYFPAAICSDMFCTRAGSCRVAKACFSGKYNSDVTWVNAKGEPTHADAKIILDASGYKTNG